MKRLLGHIRRWGEGLRFYVRARTRYDVHSPFVARLLTEVLEDSRHYYAFSDVEVWRRQRQWAGVGDVSPALGRLLFRLVCFCRPATVLDLSGGRGVTPAYLALAAREASVVAVPVDEARASEARAYLDTLGVGNVELYAGAPSQRLPELLARWPRLDCCYLDTDTPDLLACFGQCLGHLHEGSVVAVGGLHRDAEARALWEELCRCPQVRLSVAWRGCGLLFFSTDFSVRQHLTLLPWGWKFWRVGLWGR